MISRGGNCRSAGGSMSCPAVLPPRPRPASAASPSCARCPGIGSFSAMAKYPLSDHVDLQLNLTNLTDNRFYDQIHPAHVVPGPGRTALLSLTYKY